MTLKFSCNYRAFAGYLYVSESECGFTSSRFRMNIGWENVRSIQVDTKNIKEARTSVLLIKLRRNHTVSFLGEDSDVVIRDNSRKLCFYAFQDLLGAKEHIIDLWKTYNVRRKERAYSNKSYVYVGNTYDNNVNNNSNSNMESNREARTENVYQSYTNADCGVQYFDNAVINTTPQPISTSTQSPLPEPRNSATVATTSTNTAFVPMQSYEWNYGNANGINSNRNNEISNNMLYVSNPSQSPYSAPLTNTSTSLSPNGVQNLSNITNNERNSALMRSNVNMTLTNPYYAMAATSANTADSNGYNNSNNNSICNINNNNNNNNNNNTTTDASSGNLVTNVGVITNLENSQPNLMPRQGEIISYSNLEGNEQKCQTRSLEHAESSKETLMYVIKRVVVRANSEPFIGFIMIILLLFLLLTSLSRIFFTSYSSQLAEEDASKLVDSLLHKVIDSKHPLERTTQLLTQLQIAKSGCGNQLNEASIKFTPYNSKLELYDTNLRDAHHQQRVNTLSCTVRYKTNDEWIDALQESSLELMRNYVALQVELNSLRGRRSKRLGSYHAHNNVQHHWRLQRVQDERNAKLHNGSPSESNLLELAEEQPEQPKTRYATRSTTFTRKQEVAPHRIKFNANQETVSVFADDNSRPPTLQSHTPASNSLWQSFFVRHYFNLLHYYHRQHHYERHERVLVRTAHELSNFVQFLMKAFMPFINYHPEPRLPFIDVAHTNNTNSQTFINIAAEAGYNKHKSETERHHLSTEHNYNKNINDNNNNNDDYVSLKTNVYKERMNNRDNNDAVINTLKRENKCNTVGGSDLRQNKSGKYILENNSFLNNHYDYHSSGTNCSLSNGEDDYGDYNFEYNNDLASSKVRKSVNNLENDNTEDEEHLSIKQKRLLHIPFNNDEWQSEPYYSNDYNANDDDDDDDNNKDDTQINLSNTVRYAEVISRQLRVVQDVTPDEALERQQCIRLSWRLTHVAELLENVFVEFTNLFMRDLYSKLANGVERPSYWGRGPRSISSMMTRTTPSNSQHTALPEERVLRVLLLRRYASVLLYLNPLERGEQARRDDALHFVKILNNFHKMSNNYRRNKKYTKASLVSLLESFDDLILHRNLGIGEFTGREERSVLRNILPELDFWNHHEDLWLSHVIELAEHITKESEKQSRETWMEEAVHRITQKRKNVNMSETNYASKERNSKVSSTNTRFNKIYNELFYWSQLPIFRGLMCFTAEPSLIIKSSKMHEENKAEQNAPHLGIVIEVDDNNGLNLIHEDAQLHSDNATLNNNKMKQEEEEEYSVPTAATITATTAQTVNDDDVNVNNKSCLITSKNVSDHAQYISRHSNKFPKLTIASKGEKIRESSNNSSTANWVARANYIVPITTSQSDIKEVSSLWVTEHKLFRLALTELINSANKTRKAIFKINKEEIRARDEPNFINIRRRLITILEKANYNYVKPFYMSKTKKMVNLLSYWMWPPYWVRSVTHRFTEPIEHIAFSEMGMRDSASQMVAAQMIQIPWGGYNDAPHKILNNLLLQPPKTLSLYTRTKSLIYTALALVLTIVVILYFILMFA